jgi:chromosome partitioning protein
MTMLPPIIGVVLQKGGVSKTITSVNLADCVARRLGKSCLIIDMDPQGNAGKLLGIPRNVTPSIREVLLDTKNEFPLQKVIRPTSVPRLYIAPSNINLASAESHLRIPELFPHPLKQLRRKLTEEALRDIALVMIDTPPSLGLLTVNVLHACNHVIMPMDSGSDFSFDGLDDMLDVIRAATSEDHAINILGVLLVKHDRRQTLCQSAHQATVTKFGPDAFETTIASSSAVKKSEMARQTLMQCERKSSAARDYMHLADEVIRRLKLTPAPAGVTEAPVGAEELASVGAGHE